MPGKQTLEVIQKFWHPFLDEMAGAPLRLAFLFMIVQAAGNRMMHVMNFPDQVGDG